MKIICKTTLFAPPPPPPPPISHDTRVEIQLDKPSKVDFGTYTLAEGADNVQVDFGDGTTERFAAGGTISHTYANSGSYVITFSDDLQRFRVIDTKLQENPLANAIVGFTSTAQKLTEIGQLAFINCVHLAQLDLSKVADLNYGAFTGCTALPEKLYFPAVIELGKRNAYNVFNDCTSVREIHFALANKSLIVETSAYLADPEHLGAPNATIFFDL